MRPPAVPATIRMSGTVAASEAGTVAPVELPEHIVCVDCGGRCHLGSYEPPEGWEPGMVVFYRCEDCHDRWDIVIPEDAAGD